MTNHTSDEDLAKKMEGPHNKLYRALMHIKSAYSILDDPIDKSSAIVKNGLNDMDFLISAVIRVKEAHDREANEN